MSGMAKASGPRIHVLSIDGGGVRGIIPAEILAYITLKTKLLVHQMFDLIAGTSAGGIMALGLGTRCKNGAEPYSPSELADLFMSHAAEIFPAPTFPALKQLFGPKYPAGPIESILAQYFGDTMLGSALTPLLISSYDLASQKPFFFKSHKIAQDASYDVPVRRAARATSAAPTYFPPLLVPATISGWNRELCLVDGGVIVNNPAMAAYAEARMLYGTLPQVEFMVLSIGTGDRKDRLGYRSAGHWGLFKWGRLVQPILMDSVSEAVDYEMHWIDPTAFHRFQYEHLSTSSNEIDNASSTNLRSLKRQAAEYIESHQAALDAVCEQLKQGRGARCEGTGLPADLKATA